MILRFGKIEAYNGLTADVKIVVESGSVTYKKAFVLNAGGLSENRTQFPMKKGTQVACLIDEGVCLIIGNVGGEFDKSVGDKSKTYITGEVVIGDINQTITGAVRADDLVQKLNEIINAFNSHVHVATTEGAPTATPSEGGIPVSINIATVADVQSDKVKIGG